MKNQALKAFLNVFLKGSDEFIVVLHVLFSVALSSLLVHWSSWCANDSIDYVGVTMLIAMFIAFVTMVLLDQLATKLKVYVAEQVTYK